MSFDSFDQQNAQPQVVAYEVLAQGGSTSVTKEHGKGVTVSRTGDGAYRITWNENPGAFQSVTHSLQAATPGDLAGHTVIFDTYDSTNKRLDFVVYNDTPAAHDLAADEYINVTVKFKTTAV